MKVKSAVTIALLLFVAASIVVLVVKSLRPDSGGAVATDLAAADKADGPGPAVSDGVVVYYFHGSERCPTCEKMEANTREAIENGFADLLEDGSVVLREVNYESPGSEHYVRDYAIPAPAPAVVVVRMQGGKQQAWNNLERAFELAITSDKQTFIEYVQRETRAVKNGSTL